MADDIARIGPVRTRTANGGSGAPDVADCTITIGGRAHEVWWRVEGAPLSPSAESFFAVALQPAMSVGLDIESEQPLSGRLLGGLPDLMSILRCFDPALRIVDVRADRAAPRDRVEGVGLCFSLGADGMYSLVSHLDEVTHLILIHGVDYRRDAPFRQQVSDAARSVADATGKELVEISSNFMVDLLEHYELSRANSPGQAALGASLAAAAYLLRDSIGRLLIPSSATARTLLPFGSHPLVDPLFSLDGLEVVHDAIGVERIDKVAGFADFEPAFTTLRPCGRNTDGLYNCGRCRKCAYTMFMLEAVGALDRFTVFPTTLEEALQSFDTPLRFRPSPGMWFDSMRMAVERLAPGSREARTVKKLLRTSTLLGRAGRKDIRRRLRQAFLRVARGSRGGGV